MKTLNVNELLLLSDEDKEDYCNRVYPLASGSKEEFFDHDILVVVSQGRYECESCEKKIMGEAIGTSDTREPFFHFECYRKINETSDFILWEALIRKEELEEIEREAFGHDGYEREAEACGIDKHYLDQQAKG